MKTRKTIFLIIPILMYSQYNYEPSKEFSYGRANPEATTAIKDFEPMIGACECESVTRNADQTWAEPVAMTWTFKYIMNGKAVQDKTLKADGKHFGSLRQFIADSSRWHSTITLQTLRLLP